MVDVDGDGVAEVVAIAEHESGHVTTGVFAVEVASRRVRGAFGYGVFEVADLADLDGDGALDLHCRGVANRVELEGAPAFYDPAIALALSGHALLDGGRAIGPPVGAAPLLEQAERVERDGELLPRLLIPRSRWQPLPP